MKPIETISIIGAGCVGTFLAKKLHAGGFVIDQIMSKQKEHGPALAAEVNAELIEEDFNLLKHNSDLYIVAVKDDVLMEIRRKIPHMDKIIVHTSGSVPMDVFKKSSPHFGVLYPLQTIIKERDLDISIIPFFITASNRETTDVLKNFASLFTNFVQEITDEKRSILHLAAVFASNFVNYQLKIAKDILEKENLAYEILKPLVEETISKAFDIDPVKAQTGPAKRGDCNIVDKHKALLKNPDQLELYTLLSEIIKQEYKDKNKIHKKKH
jgi:predicted short-subunit dehydrogenase-like oxidoreductase (DUF2520 family)